MKKPLLVLLVMPLLMQPALCARLHGTAYDIGLEVAGGAILKVNSTPIQTIVMPNGTYSLELSPGTYSLYASYSEKGRLIMEDLQNVTIAADGDYAIDMILIPVFGISEDYFSGEFDLDINETAADGQEAGAKNGDSAPLMIAALAIAAVIAIALFAANKKRKPAGGGPSSLPEDLDKVMSILRSDGGRMNQTDLRARLPYSEAKVSLMLSDLEERGLVERFKKGRGNIIRIKK